MTGIQLSDRLRTALTGLMKVEITIRSTLVNSRELVKPYANARDHMAEIEKLADSHIDAILARVDGKGGDYFTKSVETSSTHSDRIWLSDLHPVSSSLRNMYVLLNEAIIGYSLIQPIASRFRDSLTVADDGTTGHLARQHTQDYVAAAGRIMDEIHDAVIWELDSSGIDCRCTCPSCSIGVCLGPASARAIVAQAQSDALPSDVRSGIYVHRPRAGSAAAEAGIRKGDVILAVDGIRIDSLPRIQTDVRNHRPGDRIKFRIRRGSEEFNTDVFRHYDQETDRGDDLDDCIQAAGGSFSQTRALEFHKQLRNGDGGMSANYSVLAELTAREIQILRLLAEGASNSMIAAELVISRSTVARHVANILAKLQLANRTEAATLATQAGLLARV